MIHLPRTQCGYPVGRKHMPSCTGEHRLIDGCWCFLTYGEKKLTARQWRAQRRRVQASRRKWDRQYPEIARWADGIIRDRLAARERDRALLRIALERVQEVYDLPDRLLETGRLLDHVVPEWLPHERISMTVINPSSTLKVTTL